MSTMLIIETKGPRQRGLVVRHNGNFPDTSFWINSAPTEFYVKGTADVRAHKVLSANTNSQGHIKTLVVWE